MKLTPPSPQKAGAAQPVLEQRSPSSGRPRFCQRPDCGREERVCPPSVPIEAAPLITRKDHRAPQRQHPPGAISTQTDGRADQRVMWSRRLPARTNLSATSGAGYLLKDCGRVVFSTFTEIVAAGIKAAQRGRERQVTQPVSRRRRRVGPRVAVVGVLLSIHPKGPVPAKNARIISSSNALMRSSQRSHISPSA